MFILRSSNICKIAFSQLWHLHFQGCPSHVLSEAHGWFTFSGGLREITRSLGFRTPSSEPDRTVEMRSGGLVKKYPVSGYVQCWRCVWGSHLCFDCVVLSVLYKPYECLKDAGIKDRACVDKRAFLGQTAEIIIGPIHSADVCHETPSG